MNATDNAGPFADRDGLIGLYGDKKDPANESVINHSPDQVAAIQRMSEFLTDKSECFSLIGPAGSGKSMLMREIADLASQKTWRVCLSAPTHQAAKRLREATGRHAETTHKLLGVSLVRDKKTGKEGLKAGSPMIEDKSFLIVDESSMLPEKLLQIILRFAKKYDCKVLFVGDAAQLNPVKEKPSKTVDRDTCPWELAELTTIHRQAAENPIIAAATAIRLADPKNLPVLETALNNGVGIRVMQDKRAWADLLIERCADHTEMNRYIGYANRETDEAAKAIRKHRYGADAVHPYLQGERLIVNSRCVISTDKGKRKKGSKKKADVVIPNNDEITVKKIYMDGDMYCVEADWHGHNVELQAFANYMLRDRYLSKLRNDAIRKKHWGNFFEASDNIADLRSVTSVTAHKSQGSTYDDVFINLGSMRGCRNPEELQRLLYVAITRSSRCVYLTGAL